MGRVDVPVRAVITPFHRQVSAGLMPEADRRVDGAATWANTEREH